ncbi:MAG: HDOD domain-containing protein [Spirochaetia bacterium]|nr:HDOD domain-containing protein [Spirochaetia bacterium]
MDSVYENLEIPSMPQVITRILEINENDLTLSVQELEAIISSDPNLVSKILKLANSPFYSRSNNISDLNRALSLLGFKSVKSLTLLVSIAKLLPRITQNSNIQKNLWMHSIIIAVTAKALAARIGDKKNQEVFFLAGLLRHIGQLIIYSRFPSSYESALKQSFNGLDVESLQKNELHLFGISTFILSEYAMEKWNFPGEFVRVADIIDYTPEEVFKKAGLTGTVVCFAEILASLKEAEDAKEANKSLIEKLTGFKNQYYRHFSLSNEDIDYIENKLPESFKDNEFYNFCEELFLL